MGEVEIRAAFEAALRQHQAGRLVEAERLYREVLERRPGYAPALHYLGVVLHQRGDHAQAAELIGRALAADPRDAQAWNNLGAVWQAQGDLERAADAFAHALDAGARAPQTYKNLGAVLHRLRRFDEAATAYRQALSMNGRYVEALSGLSGALLAYGRHTSADTDEAATLCERALAIDPGCVDAMVNMGAACHEQGAFEKAIGFYDRAIASRPGSMEAHTSRGAIHLLLGRFEQGWDDYEWRLGSGAATAGLRRWDAQSLSVKRILLRREQGLGDCLQFIRYARVLHESGAQVLFQCPDELRLILSRTPGIDCLVTPSESLSDFDLDAPLLSVPRLCGTQMDNIPAAIPYVSPDAGVVAEWKQRLGQIPGFKIGIVWQGNPGFRRDGARSIPLKEFAPIASVPGVTLISLQKGFGAEQIAQLNGAFAVRSYEGVGEEADGFLKTAGLIANLDLVITSDTSVAHLAGAMGAKVWTALCIPPDWRWFLDRADSPWYPTMRLFRQRRRGDWAPVFHEMAETLRCGLEQA